MHLQRHLLGKLSRCVAEIDELNRVIAPLQSGFMSAYENGARFNSTGYVAELQARKAWAITRTQQTLADLRAVA